jgi:hypothetical protein
MRSFKLRTAFILESEFLPLITLSSDQGLLRFFSISSVVPVQLERGMAMECISDWSGLGAGGTNDMRRLKSIKVIRTTEDEDEEMMAFMENIAPRSPTLRIYRIDSEEKKQEFLGCLPLLGFSLEEVRDQFGSGTFLLRSVRSNGTYGPSRVVRIAPLRRENQ